VSNLAQFVPEVRRTFFFKHTLENIPTVEPRVPSTFRELTAADLPLFAQVRSMSASKVDQFRKRMDDGDRCFGASSNGRLAHYIWVQAAGNHPLQNAGRTAPCPPGIFWLYDGRTADSARGQRIYPFAMTKVLALLRKEGFRMCLVYTAQGNQASQRGMMRVGFEPTCRLTAIVWRGRAYPLPLPWKRRSMVEIRSDGTVR
jgi:hypothetical protein